MRQSGSVRGWWGAAWREKFLLGTATGLLCTLVYRTLQDFPSRAPVWSATCFSWKWIPFHPGWAWPYFSMFGLVGLAWLFLPNAQSVWRFAGCLLAMAAVAWTFFYFYPTACVRPVVPHAPLAYQLLMALDRPTNCFPCLHSAFAVLSIAVIGAAKPGWRVGLGVWFIMILVSIVALRQHTDVDTLAGVGLGGLAGWVWCRQKITP